MNKEKAIKIGSLVVTLLGAGVSVVSTMLEDKKLDNKIAEKVAEVAANLNKNEES